MRHHRLTIGIVVAGVYPAIEIEETTVLAWTARAAGAGAVGIGTWVMIVAVTVTRNTVATDVMKIPTGEGGAVEAAAVTVEAPVVRKGECLFCRLYLTMATCRLSYCSGGQLILASASDIVVDRLFNFLFGSY